MGYDKCASPGCVQRPAARVDRISHRCVTDRLLYCEEHAYSFMADYYAVKRIGDGTPVAYADGVVFDIELLLYDDRPNKSCQFCLREVGGGRRVDCGISAFDAAALWWQVETFTHPRPLTHTAMASVITAMGGRLVCVVIDKFFPGQKVAYEAKLRIQQMNATLAVDVRPSDAVVLAVVSDSPIIVSNDVLAALKESQQ